MRQAFKIRRATGRDAEGLAKLYMQIWHVHENSDPLLEAIRPPTIKENMEIARKDLRKKNVYCFVAEQDNELIGYIELRIVDNEYYFKIKKYGKLFSATTDKKHRGKGVARALTEYGMHFLKKKGIRYVETIVYLDNEVALKTWQKLGFKPVSYTMLKKV